MANKLELDKIYFVYHNDIVSRVVIDTFGQNFAMEEIASVRFIDNFNDPLMKTFKVELLCETKLEAILKYRDLMYNAVRSYINSMNDIKKDLNNLLTFIDEKYDIIDKLNKLLLETENEN